MLPTLVFFGCGSEFYRSFDRRKAYDKALRPGLYERKSKADETKSTARQFDQALYAALLRDCVTKEKGINLIKLKMKRSQLLRYIKALGNSIPSAYQQYEWDAFMINAFNAFVLQLVVEAKSSNEAQEFRRTPEWEKPRFRLGESLVSLSELEEVIFGVFQDTRKRMTLISGLASNPPLREEPYYGYRLPEQVLNQFVRYKSEEDIQIENAMGKFSPK